MLWHYCKLILSNTNSRHSNHHLISAQAPYPHLPRDYQNYFRGAYIGNLLQVPLAIVNLVGSLYLIWLYCILKVIYVYAYLCTKIIVLYELSHVISKDLDGGATEDDGRASAPVGPSVATPLEATNSRSLQSFKQKLVISNY